MAVTEHTQQDRVARLLLSPSDRTHCFARVLDRRQAYTNDGIPGHDTSHIGGQLGFHPAH